MNVPDLPLSLKHRTGGLLGATGEQRIADGGGLHVGVFLALRREHGEVSGGAASFAVAESHRARRSGVGSSAAG